MRLPSVAIICLLCLFTKGQAIKTSSTSEDAITKLNLIFKKGIGIKNSSTSDIKVRDIFFNGTTLRVTKASENGLVFQNITSNIDWSHFDSVSTYTNAEGNINCFFNFKSKPFLNERITTYDVNEKTPNKLVSYYLNSTLQSFGIELPPNIGMDQINKIKSLANQLKKSVINGQTLTRSYVSPVKYSSDGSNIEETISKLNDEFKKYKNLEFYNFLSFEEWDKRKMAWVKNYAYNNYFKNIKMYLAFENEMFYLKLSYDYSDFTTSSDQMFNKKEHSINLSLCKEEIGTIQLDCKHLDKDSKKAVFGIYFKCDGNKSSRSIENLPIIPVEKTSDYDRISNLEGYPIYDLLKKLMRLVK